MVIIISNVSRRKTSIFLFLGIIMGLCFGFVLKNYRALELVKRCNFKPNVLNRTPLEIINLNPGDTILNSQNNLLFVGVMTAKNFLQGRAKAVYDTWGRDVPGKIAFFSSEDSFAEGLPIVSLKGVDDRYPPQKKSFMMLYYMYEHFIDKFEWFARADDDVYINTRKLEKFLRSIDSSKPQFIGQAGKGNTEEFGLLSLEFDENFCMGGPGVILSRETLRRVAPHIPTCLKNLYSTHEDVEIGRCVQKFAGIPCTWNYEMQSILHHNSSGSHAFTGSLKSKEIHSAITLHPVKRAPLMYRLHSYMQGLRGQELRQETLSLHRDIAQMKKLLQFDDGQKLLVAGVPIFPIDKSNNDRLFLGDPDILGKSPTLNKYRREMSMGNVADVDGDSSAFDGDVGDAAAGATATNEIQYWNFLARSIYSADHSNPKRRLESSWREGLDDVITEIMENINNFSRQRGRVIEFRELLYGYSRVNTLYGHDLILDLLMIYKKYRGKKMTVPVRRHLYVQRAFTDVFVKELNKDVGPNFMWLMTSHQNDTGAGAGTGDEQQTDKLAAFSSKMKNLWNTGLGKLSDRFPLTGGGGGGGDGGDGFNVVEDDGNDKDGGENANGYNFNNNNNIYKIDGNFLGRSREDQDNGGGGAGAAAAVGSNDYFDQKIVFVLSLAGRFSIFQRFLKNYEEVCLKLQQYTDLIVVLFDDQHNNKNEPNLSAFYDELNKLRAKYADAKIHEITLKGNFSRGIALDTATRSEYIQMDSIILFIDVDITFRLESLERIRRNTIKRKQVYLPIVFSQYDPKRIVQPSQQQRNDSIFFNDMNSDFYHPVNIGYELGYFRQYGYGICSIFKSDIMHTAINGFNTDINGWGLEDVKFLEKIIKLNQKPILILSNTAIEPSSSIVGGNPGNNGGNNADDLKINRQDQQIRNDIFNNNNNNNNRNDGSSSPPSSSAPMHLSIFRAVDPSLVHVFHDINCDKNLEESQYAMCLGTKANAFGSYRHIESILLNNKDIIDFVSLMNTINNNNNNNNNNINGDKLK